MALINKRKLRNHGEQGKVTLYQLSGQEIGGKYYQSDKWYASIKLYKNKYSDKAQPLIRFSTGTSNYNKAVKFAVQEFKELAYRHERNLPLSKIKYSIICKKFIEKLSSERRFLEDQNIGHYTKISVSKKIQTVERFLVPFFGSFNIEDIQDREIKDFKNQRMTDVGGTSSKNKKNISAGTLNKTLTVFRQVFKYAVDQGIIESTRIPIVSNKIRPKDEIPRNPDFSPSEYSVLVKTARQSWKDERHPRTKNQKYLLLHLILILSNTGARMAEIRNLRWEDIVSYKDKVKTIPINGDINSEYLKEFEYIKIAFYGKVSRSTQKKWSSPQQKVKVYFDRLKETQKEWANVNGWEWSERVKVFVNPYGEEVVNFNKGFNVLLNKTGLTYAPVGDTDDGAPILKKRNLGGLRHLYAKKMLRAGWDYFALAKNMRSSPEMLNRFYANEVDVDNIPVEVMRMRQQRYPAIEERFLN